MVKKIRILLLSIVALSLVSNMSAQSSFLDLTIVETSNYNKALSNFSYSNFENTFIITRLQGSPIFESNINKALFIFLNQLAPETSYMIQHEPTYYFVFQYRERDDNYLVMNNTIGTNHEAIYCETFKEAQRQMLKLLQTFYQNIPIVSIREHK